MSSHEQKPTPTPPGPGAPAEALAVQPATGQPRGTVVEVSQKGYALDGRLIRPALVVVAQ